jgi:signal transduction histidine kinase
MVQPALEDGLLTGSPTALDRLDTAVRASVLGPRVVRVKVWTPEGTIIYSDEPRIVGETFALGEEERSVLVAPTTHAEVSDLTRPENRYETGGGKLLEVYRPVWTPSGQPLLFETYMPYDSVTARTGELWRGFAGITLASLLLLIALLLPILWRLLDRVNSAQEQRVALLEHAVDASSDERQRIAATLHDGVVQELAAASFAVSGAAERAATDGRRDLADVLTGAATAVRGTIGGLRSLLVDIYPPSLRTAGLVAALTDLAGTVRTRGIDVRLVLPPDGQTGLDEEQERLVFRVAQESLRNTARHAAASHVEIRLVVAGDGVTFSVCDNGVGFDVEAALNSPPEGHLGLRVMRDLTAQSGALLEVSSAPGAGACWRLTVPRR